MAANATTDRPTIDAPVAVRDRTGLPGRNSVELRAIGEAVCRALLELNHRYAGVLATCPHAKPTTGRRK